jgi:large subunit ribosomal protein L25
VHREIDLESLPLEIPDSIEIDISNLGLNDAVYVRDVAQGARWTPISDADMMLIHIVTPRLVEATTPEAATTAAPVAAGSEPEVVKKGKTEKEGETAAAKDKGKK